ncbi:hypothetical protein EfsSVR2281_32100 [Enterococcus faecalis]|nr:hypothetical protein EfsSVR2281_32100 [Enterococcus faecalis]
MQQNIVLSIQDRLQQLPKSERKIAEYILKNTETVISMNAQELAKQAGSSPAAIIRFCHSMDVNGFTELKLLLSANLGQMKQQMYTEVTKGESTADIKQKLQARFVHVVERSGQTLEDVAVNEAVDLLEKNRSNFCLWVGCLFVGCSRYLSKIYATRPNGIYNIGSSFICFYVRLYRKA